MKRISILLSALMVLFAHCDEPDVQGELATIDFRLTTATPAGEATQFSAGDDVIFSLTLVNEKNEPIPWSYGRSCQVLGSKGDFLMVYRKSAEGTAGFKAIGNPIQSPGNCLLINLPDYPIPPGDNAFLTVPWSNNPDNANLPAGTYYVRCEFSVEVEGESRSWELRTDFEIK